MIMRHTPVLVISDQLSFVSQQFRKGWGTLSTVDAAPVMEDSFKKPLRRLFLNLVVHYVWSNFAAAI